MLCWKREKEIWSSGTCRIKIGKTAPEPLALLEMACAEHAMTSFQAPHAV